MAYCNQTAESIQVQFENGTVVSLRLTPDGDVIGLGNVGVAGIPLRNGSPLLYPWIRSLAGMDYTRFPLRKVEERADGSVAIHTTAVGIPRFESPYGDQYNDHLFMVSEKSAPVEDRLTWILAPAGVTLDGVRYEGFSYRWEFESATQKIHRIVAHTTWELGGKATGNTILSQGQVTPAVYTAETATHFTSACLQSLQRFGDPTAMSFQFSPRWAVHQCFDFLAHERGTLLGYWEGKHDTRSFVQKNPNEDVFFVIDAEHWKASKSVSTTAKSVVFAPAGAEGMPEHAARNRWKAAYDHCNGIVRDLFHIRKSIPAPERVLPYGQRLLPGDKLEMRVNDTWVPSQEWLKAMADELLPAVARQGIKRVIPESLVESDPTERGFISKLGGPGLHGDLNVGSVCCVHRYRPAGLFGGMPAWRYFCEKAHSLGLEVGHWIGPHLAHHAPILQDHPDWAIKGFNTLDAAGGYPNYELTSLNWNTPVRQWIFDDLRRMREEGGLDYVWFDSLSNLGLLPIDFSKEMETNTFAIMEFIADLQGIGIANIAVEGMSPVAMSGAYLMDHGPGHDGGVAWIAGQNSWLWYDQNEDMLCDQQPRTYAHKERSEENVKQRYFRCLANHTAPELPRFMPVSGELNPWVKEMAANFEAVKADMGKRELLPDKRGVLWRRNGTTTLFAYAEFAHALPAGAKVSRIEAGKPVTVACNGCLQAKAWSVYRIA
jgi:hypothetical protein